MGYGDPDKRHLPGWTVDGEMTPGMARGLVMSYFPRARVGWANGRRVVHDGCGMYIGDPSQSWDQAWQSAARRLKAELQAA